ncbi:uncharacterized protein BcabD6B2_54550 [Babesia caballi]|uniref:Uncharacterized protein n=1 Tax=Babesia caballi TaxID=5871 RepID=A0AAV4M1W3_BABCB|nr:hypothetical protein BcabD6B2_54550 [Babesia caballi]
MLRRCALNLLEVRVHHTGLVAGALAAQLHPLAANHRLERLYVQRVTADAALLVEQRDVKDDAGLVLPVPGLHVVQHDRKHARVVVRQPPDCVAAASERLGEHLVGRRVGLGAVLGRAGPLQILVKGKVLVLLLHVKRLPFLQIALLANLVQNLERLLGVGSVDDGFEHALLDGPRRVLVHPEEIPVEAFGQQLRRLRVGEQHHLLNELVAFARDLLHPQPPRAFPYLGDVALVAAIDVHGDGPAHEPLIANVQIVAHQLPSAAVLPEVGKHGKAQLFAVRRQRAEVLAQVLRQHRVDAVLQINRGCPLPGVQVDQRAPLHVVADVGDVDAYRIPGPAQLVLPRFDRKRVVEVLGVLRVDGEDEEVASVDAVFILRQLSPFDELLEVLHDAVRKPVRVEPVKYHRGLHPRRRVRDAAYDTGDAAAGLHLVFLPVLELHETKQPALAAQLAYSLHNFTAYLIDSDAEGRPTRVLRLALDHLALRVEARLGVQHADEALERRRPLCDSHHSALLADTWRLRGFPGRLSETPLSEGYHLITVEGAIPRQETKYAHTLGRPRSVALIGFRLVV